MISKILTPIEITLILSVAAFYIVHCPFNKVEESFNTQAIHDIVNIFPNIFYNKNEITKATPLQTEHGSKLSLEEIAHRSQMQWDHTQYPGVVPRTFIGALLIGLPLKLAKGFIQNSFVADDYHVKDDHDFTAQFILQLSSRFALTTFFTLSLSKLLGAIHRKYGLGYRFSFLIITVSQFHYMYYAGRFLPNTYAAILSNYVFASWINRHYSESIIYIAFSVVIFRCDTALFFGWLLADGIFIRRFLSITRVLRIGVPAGLIAIITTFIIDSILWQRPVWPELEGLYYNVWLNKSHEWGTQPYFWYVYSCIPRMMLTSSILLLLAEHKFTRDYLIPVLTFIFTYSILPHKELRFILFVTPLLNLCAASGLMNIYYYINKLFLNIGASTQEVEVRKDTTSSSRRSKKKVPLDNMEKGQVKSKAAAITFSIIIICFFLIPNLLACFVLSRISSHNYPGGQAAMTLGFNKELLDAAKKSLDIVEESNLKDFRSDVAVYVNNLAAQTGVSRFIQVDGAYYSKTPEINSTTFTKGYDLIYFILESNETKDFLKKFCLSGGNRERVFEKGLGHWGKMNDEIKCIVPNQSEMYCSIVDIIKSFKSIYIGSLLKSLRQVRSLQALITTFEDSSYIKTRTALYIIRCGTRSKFNPFS